MKFCLSIIAALVVCSFQNHAQNKDFTTPFETSMGTETPTYDQVIDYYQALANHFPQIKMLEMGATDSGKPLHIVIFNSDSNFDFAAIRKSDRILLINNGIHPGEPDGIDATMMLFRDLANGTIEKPTHTTVVSIPIYNIGGSLNRNSTSRTNQEGPKAYGFRGNAKNYDLNRDFIKSDTKNARSFAELFHLIKPDVFIDNHVSNGADYQYTLTHLFTQHNKLGGNLGDYLHEQLMPKLENELKKAKWDITPYVNVFNSVPEAGFSQFMDYPRYSTGYTTLWNSLGMMVETHMLKPYKQRVEGTYQLMKSMIKICEEDGEKIGELRKKAFDFWTSQSQYPLDWQIDSSKTSTLNFKGFEGKMVASDITGKMRLKYDNKQPFTKQVSYQNYAIPTSTVTIPKAYIIPQGWHNVIDLLKLNDIEMQTMTKDSTITVETYRIENFDTRKNPYEGHYQHYDTKLSKQIIEKSFRKGDVMVRTHQAGLRYLLETLEPEAADSFFNWNFFDTILQQKEGFSPYVWEDKASELLKANDSLRKAFEAKKKDDPSFGENWYAQLDWLHKQSDHYETAHMQYPVYRVIK